MDRRLLEYHPDIDVLGSAAATRQRQAAAVAADEMVEAVELLASVDSGEAEAYLVELIDRAGRPREPGVAAALARILGRAARRLLTVAGSARAAAQGRVFGLELEGLSPEDQAFEVARRFVRFTAEAARRASDEPGAGSPEAVARRSASLAARALAPGLLPAPKVPSPSSKESPMHHIDHTQTEYSSEMSGHEAEQFEFAEGEWAGEAESVLGEADEHELAAELLGVASEDELDQFLGGLIKRVAKRGRRLVRSSTGRAIGGVLKGVAKRALPLAGGALGAVVAGPLGAQIGSGLAAAAAGEPGADGEPSAQAQEDQEFDGAKQFVRLAANTVNQAVAAPAAADPRVVAQAAAISAARALAPGLLKKSDGRDGLPSTASRAQSGRWVRLGNTIVIHGV
jgi:hypothetical protein